MATKDLAQGLASLGRYGDSMLVHMNPEEVAGLQVLAKSRGGTLTVNPDTGMPEAFLGDIAGAVLPIAAGFALGPGGFGLFNSALTAGLAVGVGAYALTGDPMYGLSAGLGGAGGFGLGSNLSAFGTTAKTPAISQVAKVGANASSIPGTTGLGMFADVADDLAASTIPTASKVASPALTGFDAAASGVKKVFEPGGFGNYADFLKKGYTNVAGEFVQPSVWQDALTVASPVVSGLMQPPQPLPNLVGSMPMASNYQGPYLPAPRARRMPTEQERLQMASMGSPEFTYFSPSNPVPGFTYAQGGAISTGGIRDLYGTADDQLNGSARLSQDGYGLGRLDTMYGTQMAEGGPVSFEAGGTIPAIGSTASIPKTGMDNVGVPAGLEAALSNAIADPLGRVAPESSAQPSDTLNMQAARMAPQVGLPPPPMAAQPLVNPAMPPLSLQQSATAQPIRAAQGGIMSLARGGKPSSGGYLDGPGDGMSDDIPATIAGKQPARLADGEFVIPADVVSHLGNGSTKAGAKHLYKMMDRVRQARTGTKKQGRQINPSKYLKA